MEKINILELLKDSPQGMELDCAVYNDVTFLRIDEVQNRCYFKAGPADTFWTTCEGRINGSPFGKCVIFPKGKTTWEGFVPPCKFKDGDIVSATMYTNGTWIGIFKQYEKRYFESYCSLNTIGEFRNIGYKNHSLEGTHLATEEEKQKLFQAIKDNGYKWNAETKTLEKLVEPKFKVGDTIQDVDGYKVEIAKVDIDEESYEYISIIAKGIGSIPFELQDEWELVPNKFDITTLKPFDKVLVRDNDDKMWTADIFSFYNKKLVYPFMCVGHYTSQCIPYEQNKHLLGTTSDCDEHYKTWE